MGVYIVPVVKLLVNKLDFILPYALVDVDAQGLDDLVDLELEGLVEGLNHVHHKSLVQVVKVLDRGVYLNFALRILMALRDLARVGQFGVTNPG